MTTLPESLSARPITSSNYVRNWGPWEAFRELVCNAMDADPTGTIIDYPSPDTATIYTRTAPTFYECCVVGEGSKAPGESTIGQFGEGLKLAALTAVRAGGSLSVRTPDFTATYTLRTEPGARYPILYIIPRRVPPSKSRPGCLISITMPGAKFRQFQTNFVDPTSSLIAREPGDDLRIYCKGVLITTFKNTPSLYHYNLCNLELNRDRSSPSTYSLYSALTGTILDCIEAGNHDLAASLLGVSDDSIENLAILNYHFHITYYTKATAALGAALASRYGAKYVLPCKRHIVNDYAASCGYSIVSVPSGISALLLGAKLIENADTLLNCTWKPSPCPSLSDKHRATFLRAADILQDLYSDVPFTSSDTYSTAVFDASSRPPSDDSRVITFTDPESGEQRVLVASDAEDLLSDPHLLATNIFYVLVSAQADPGSGDERNLVASVLTAALRKAFP